MTILQTADGRMLRAQSSPSGSRSAYGSGFPTSFAPLWSDGERYPNALTDGMDGVLASYGLLYRSQPVLAGVIDMLAYRAATLPFAAFKENENGSRDPVGRLDTLSTLLRRPRPGYSTVHLLNFVFTSLFTHGNALLVKVRPNADPGETPDMLWPLDWSHISAYGELGGTIEAWSTTQFGSEVTFDASETVHFAWPADDGAEIGVSPLEKLGVTIRLEDAAQRYQTANFRNGNRPSGALLFKGPLTPDQTNQVRTQMAGLHGGIDRTGKTLVLSGDADYKQLSMTAVEASLIDQRRLDREEVAIVFGLSGPSLTDSTNSALGNVVERFRAFYRDVLPPWATLVCETFEAQLLDMETPWMGRLVRFDFADKLRGEPRENAEKLNIEVVGGWRTRNEARKESGMPPFGDPEDPKNPANVLTYSSNNQAPLEDLTKPKPAPVMPQPPALAASPAGAEQAPQ